MSCADSARTAVLEAAASLEKKANGYAMLRSVDATETAKWLREVVAALREAAGPDEPPSDGVANG